MMSAKEFSAAVRAGTGTFSLQKVVIICGPRHRIRGSGSLILKPDRIELSIQVRPSVRLPPVPKVVVREKECWKLTGLVNGELGITTRHLQPAPQWAMSGAVQTLTFRVAALDLDIPRHDRQVAPQTADGRKRRIAFRSVIPKAKLAFLNAGTETKSTHPYLGEVGSSSSLDSYIAETRDFDFALIERDGDLQVHARSRPTYRGRNPLDDERIINGLLHAVAFVHGYHTWPCRHEVWRSGRKVLDRVRVPEPRVRSHYPAFSWGHIGTKENDPKHGVGQSLRLMAEYLGSGEPLADALIDYLHLYREATDERAHFHLGTHALCAILEGLVRTVGKHIDRSDPAAKAEVARFEEEKVRAAVLLEALPVGNQRLRLIGIIKGASARDIQGEFVRACVHLGLPWETLFREHFRAWKTERNRSHHGELASSRDEEFSNRHLIAAGITLIALRIVGYHGKAYTDLWHRESALCQI